jgi:hypothetical protein
MYLKKAGYLLLWVLLLLQAGGWLLCYEVQRMCAHSEMHHIIHRRNRPTAVLRLSVSVYNSHKVGKDELLLDGRMYDICSKRSVGIDEVLLTVVRDKKEERAIANKGKVMGEKDPDGQLPRVAAQLMEVVYVLPAIYAVHTEWHEVRVKAVCIENCSFLSRYPDIVAPPPWVA